MRTKVTVTELAMFQIKHIPFQGKPQSQREWVESSIGNQEDSAMPITVSHTVMLIRVSH